MREVLPECTAMHPFSHEPMDMILYSLVELLNQEEVQGSTAAQFSGPVQATSAGLPPPGGSAEEQL